MLSGVTQTGIRFQLAAPGASPNGHLTVNGTLDNQVTNETGNKLEVVDPTAADRRTLGQFFLNGQLITLPPAASPFTVD